MTTQVISAQQLPRPRDALATDAESVSMDPFVEVSLSVPGFPNAVKRRTNVVMYVIIAHIAKTQADLILQRQRIQSNFQDDDDDDPILRPTFNRHARSRFPPFRGS